MTISDAIGELARNATATWKARRRVWSKTSFVYVKDDQAWRTMRPGGGEPFTHRFEPTLKEIIATDWEVSTE